MAARGGKQRDIRTAQHTGARHGVAHLAGGMVGDIPHGIHGFLRSPGGNHHLFAAQVLLAGKFAQHIVNQDPLVRQTSRADIAARQHARAGRNDRDPVMLKRFEVILRDGVFQHMGVHGGGDQLGAVRRQRDGGQHIVRLTVRYLGNDIGGGRGDQQQVGGVCQRNMRYIILEVAVKGVHNAAAVGQRFKHQGGDELSGVFGHQHMDIRTQLDQCVRHIGHFIGSNAAGDTKDNGFSL